MTDPLDVCPQCSDPWCSCDCGLCEFVGSTPEAARERLKYGECDGGEAAYCNVLNGKELRIRYYRGLIARLRKAEGIVSDLAKCREPFNCNDSAACNLCLADVDAEGHDDTCPWLRATEATR